MAKGKGKPTGWITRNGVHIPIYGEYTAERNEPKLKKKHKREKDMNMDLFKKLPKYLQKDNIIDMNKDRTIDGIRYRALIEFDDGFQRSISEYGWGEFKDYLKEVMTEDRKAER